VGGEASSTLGDTVKDTQDTLKKKGKGGKQEKTGGGKVLEEKGRGPGGGRVEKRDQTGRQKPFSGKKQTGGPKTKENARKPEKLKRAKIKGS